MDQNAYNAFKTALPTGGAVLFNPSQHHTYLTDASSAIGGEPLGILFPKTHEEIEAILSIANATHTPIVPRAAGTGKTGNAVSVKGAMILDVTALNAILEIDHQNRVVVTQPAVPLKTLQEAVEAEGLFYPPDPASLETCTIGGNVAVNAGGPRCLKYGVTGQYVLGLEGVWANGKAFHLGGKLYKNVSGYDLMRLLIGSEGTLGIITKITLKLLPLPAIQRTVWATFSSINLALECLNAIRNTGLIPATAELIDRTCIEAVSTYLNQAIREPNAIHVLFQIDGTSQDTMATELARMTTCILRYGNCLDTEENATAMWAVRRSISKALSATSTQKESHDITVPLSQLQATFDFISSLNTDPTCVILGYGHLGDGNLHVNILNRGLSEENWLKVKPEIENKLFHFAVSRGGSISGEHGIGLTKKHYMTLQYSSDHLALLKAIKGVFDPNGILNPGKII